ncbi:MAG: Crp/Fnr family transcriptional regulator [Pseudomonadota bacterium]
MSPIEFIHADATAYGISISADEISRLDANVSAATYRKNAVVFAQSSITNALLLVTQGVAGSLQSLEDGSCAIARFFEAGDFCTNINSAFERIIHNDELVAMTPLTGIVIDFGFFLEMYRQGGSIGHYFREKLMAVLLYDKDLLCVKTLASIEHRYRFLETRHPDVIAAVTDKNIARFLGVTPQGLSRFLKNRRIVNRG